jgi:hypothetical protein
MPRSDERTEFYEDIITTAVEGGTGYWAQVSQYQFSYDGETRLSVGEQVGEGTRAVLHAIKDDESGYEEEGHVLDAALIAHAFGVLRRLVQDRETDNGQPGGLSTTKGENAHLSAKHRKHLLGAYADLDAGDIDADDADILVQLGLFGKVVYG